MPAMDINRYRGCLLGLASGDALGTTLEFKAPGSFVPLTEMVGGGPFDLAPGQWTDDTSMALCLATSLVECQGFDARDQITRYCRWYRQGYMSSTGFCFGIGNATQQALQRFEQTGEVNAGSADFRSAGNGSLMRLAPVPMFFASDLNQATVMAAKSSLTTHAAVEAVAACRYFAALIVGALLGATKNELLTGMYRPELWQERPLAPAIAQIATGTFQHKQPPTIRGSGYVVECLEAALWAFRHSTSFAQGALLAVNLGDDADTTGAVYGQLAGAYYGLEAIPPVWQQKISDCQKIIDLADSLYALAVAADTKNDIQGG